MTATLTACLKCSSIKQGSLNFLLQFIGNRKWNRNKFKFLKTLTSVSLLSRQCRILDISQPHRPPRPVTGNRFTFYVLHSLCVMCLLLFLLLCVMRFVWAWCVILCNMCILVCCILLYSGSHSRVAPENVGLQKEQKYNTFACHTRNEVLLCVLGIRKTKK
jgi:hypothetical protein